MSVASTTCLAETESLRLVKVSDSHVDPNSSSAWIAFENVFFSGVGPVAVVHNNPRIVGHNLYAADLVRAPGGATAKWTCFCGGWEKPGQVHDRIYACESQSEDPTQGWSDVRVIIDHGEYRHVNDPSVLIDDSGRHHMLYTAARNATDPKAGTFFRDWVNYSSSPDGVNWTPSAGAESTEITISDPDSLAPGVLTSIARPALVKTKPGWSMWFDGRTNQKRDDESLHSYLARSTGPTPVDFRIVHRYPDINGMPGFFEPDVELQLDGTYLAVVQRGFRDLWYATSSDGIHFTFAGPVLQIGNPYIDRERISNPGLIYDQVSAKNSGVAFGMADPTLMNHDIGFAANQYIVKVRSPAGTVSSAPVWHTFASSKTEHAQRLSVFQFRNFDLARVIDPQTGKILLEQDFSRARAGDVWQLQLISSSDRTGNRCNSGIPSSDLKPIRICLIGDSTVATYDHPPKDRPDLTGWGQVFGKSFCDKVTVLNYAVSGRSSKSFLREGLWQPVLEARPDFVFIQFGHNDESGKGDRSTDPNGEYRANLRRYVHESRDAGATPILVTPVARRKFRDDQPPNDTELHLYAAATREVGRETKTLVVDLHAASIAKYRELGDRGSADFSPSPTDRTHFSQTGALEIAELVTSALRKQSPELGQYLLDPSR
ncbi:rhamnogalacturonan acetylesterase [Pirellulales bacterium]|nr:rhamnogalacturonan acetylesterase [Pirellulales bacterium]